MTDGLLRVGCRLDSALLPYDLKHPIIPPECHFLTKIIIRDAHEQTVGHCGVNATLNALCQRFWILNAKVAVRRVISTSVTCKKVHSPCKIRSWQICCLPDFKSAPFCDTGVDLFGPLTVKVKRSNVKRYGCLFTCMTTRVYFYNKTKIFKKKSSSGLLFTAKILQEAMRLSYPYLYKINQKIEHQNARSYSCFGFKLSVKGGLNNLIFICLS